MRSSTRHRAGTLLEARQRLALPMVVLLRPRGGDFLYTDSEFDESDSRGGTFTVTITKSVVHTQE